MAPKRRKAAKKRRKSTKRRSSGGGNNDLGGIHSMSQNGILSQIKPIPGMAID